MRALCKKVGKKFPHILVDTKKELHSSPVHVARALKRLSAIKQLDTDAYTDAVNKKKIRKPAVPDPTKQEENPLKVSNRQLKRLNRALKKRSRRQEKQINRLRTTCKRLKRENRDLKATIKKLQAGAHDIQLQGQSQSDMEWFFSKCDAEPQMQQQFKEQDPSGTLEAFWREQAERSKSKNRR